MVSNSARRPAGLVAAVLAVVAWVLMMRADAANVYVEPTTTSIANAAARPVAIVAAAALIGLVLVVAGLGRRRWVTVFALPGVLTVVFLIAFPSAHGAALLYSVLGSVIAAVAAAGVAVRALTARPSAATPTRPAAPKH